MDNVETGTLYLTEFAGDGRCCAWRSLATGQNTPWHGKWDESDGRLKCYFDCHGKDPKKWTVLHGPPHGMIGTDYKGRHIRAYVASTYLRNHDDRGDWLLQSDLQVV